MFKKLMPVSLLTLKESSKSQNSEVNKKGGILKKWSFFSGSGSSKTGEDAKGNGEAATK